MARASGLQRRHSAAAYILLRWCFLLLFSAGLFTASAGPVEFGLAEYENALAARGLNPKLFHLRTEVTTDAPETYRVMPGVVTGGDLRGIMYGLLEAAEQIRTTGRIRAAEGKPTLAFRGVRFDIASLEGSAEWFHSRDDWPAVFRTLARHHFNRFLLVIPDLSWFVPPEDDRLRLRNLETLAFISQTASEYGVDVVLGVGGCSSADGPQVEAAVSKVLSACPFIRSVHVSLEQELAMYAIRALREGGRRLTMEAPLRVDSLASAAASSGLPLRLALDYPSPLPRVRKVPVLWTISSLPPAVGYQKLVAQIGEAGASGFDARFSEELRDAAIALDRVVRAGGIRVYSDESSTARGDGPHMPQPPSPAATAWFTIGELAYGPTHALKVPAQPAKKASARRRVRPK